MEDHNNEKRPRQQGRSNYTRRAPRANNNNQNRKPGASAPAASAPQCFFSICCIYDSWTLG